MILRNLITQVAAATLLFSLPAAAQVPLNSAGKIEYTNVEKVEGISKDVLYDRALASLQNIYSPAFQSKVSKADKDEGVIIIKGFAKPKYYDKKSKTTTFDVDPVKYKLTVHFKDGRYKYSFDDFHINKGGYKLPMEKYVNGDKEVEKDHPQEKLESLDKEIREIIAKFTSETNNGPKTSKEKDW